MAQSVTEQLLNLDYFLVENVQWASVLYDYLGKMRKGYFEGWYLASILQKHVRSRDDLYDLYDAYYFALVHTGLCRGRILSAQVVVGQMPSMDRDLARNNPVLSSLPFPFSSPGVRGGTGGNDGSLEWRESVRFGQITHNGIEGGKYVDPMMVPLEVGYTDGSTTVKHLIESRALARWPLFSERIYIFYVDDEDLWRPPY
jgi:hypothetical protein